MRLIDKTKICLHNIKNNKSRFVLTTIIVYVISLLIMSLLFLAISISNNICNISKAFIEQKLDYCTTSFYINNYNSDSEQNYIDKNTYSKLIDVLEENHLATSIVEFSSNNINSNIFITSYFFPIDNNISIVEGNNFSENECDTKKVLISKEFADYYYSTSGELLKPNSIFNYQINFRQHMEKYNEVKTINLELEVLGIFKSNNLETKIDTYGSKVIVSNDKDIIIDAGYLFDSISDFSITNGTFYYYVPNEFYNTKEFISLQKTLIADLNSVIPDNEYESNNGIKKSESLSNNIIETIETNDIFRIIIIAIISFICIILVLLSIGSLANSIMISVDNSKKFIGLLKALGLKENDLKATFRLESLFAICFGVMISFLSVVLMRPILQRLNVIIVSSASSYLLNTIDYTIKFEFPIYIPIIVILFFTLLSILFSKSSMSKIGKMDPMAVISEVI